MFNRWMTKLFGSEKKPDGDKTKERRHSFEEVDSPKSSYYTRSKGKKRSSPEPKRRRSDVPPIDSNNSATTIDDNVNNDSSTENTWQSMVVVKSPSPESTVIPDPPSPESTLVPDPPSPENPVMVETQTMSTSVWENVEPSITKEHIYKDCVVIETVSEHSDRLWKESLLPFPEMPIDDNVCLSTGSFISVESMSDSGVSKEKLIVKNKNQNALIEEDTLKSSESENRKMSSSFIHVEMDEKLVQDKDSIKNVNTECKTNVENGASHNTETVNITNGVRHSNSKDEIKVKHETKEETSCQQEDAKYVVPKLPVSKGKGGNKVANLGKTTEENQDHKKEGKKQKNPEKSTTVKNEKVISKEKDSLRKEKEPSTNTVGSKDEKMESCGSKEAPDTNAYPIKTVGKDKSTEQDGVKQKYVIPSKRNKDSAASPEKQEEYTTEPRNFVEFVERKTARRMMVDAKMLMYELGFLKDVKQTEIESAVIGQYKIATEKKLFAWIKQARYNAELIFSQTWIEENLPTLGGKKVDWKKKKQERRRGHSEYESKPPCGMCRDVRLETDPTLQVVRENLGVQRLETDPTLQVVRENLGVQQSPQVTCQDGQLQSKSKTLNQQHISDKENGEASTDIPKDEPRSLECKYSDVILESNPPTVVREITSEKLEQTKLESKRDVGHSRPSRLKYTDVRLETNPNLEVVRENAADKSRSSPLKLTDIGLERNTDILVVPENTSGKTECNKNNKSESITLICGQNKLDLEEKKESLKDTRGGNSDGELRETESDNGKTEQIMEQSELIKDVNKSKPEIGNNEKCEYDIKSEKVTQKSEMMNIVDMTVDLRKYDDKQYYKQCVDGSQSQSIHLDRSQPENKDLDERNSVKDKSDLESKEFSQSQSIHLDRSQPENKDLDERNSVKDKSDLESKEFSKVGTYLTYCEALKAPAKSESGTEICESTSEKEHDKNTIRKEVSNSLNSLLVLVESEISKTFDDNGNPISNNDSDELPCDGCKNGSTKADVDTEELDKTGKETKNIGSEFSGKKMTENVNASIISRVEVKKEGDGFIVNTELKGDDAELKNNTANNRVGMQSEVSNKTDIQSESSNETDICLESIKSQYVSALDLVHAQISAEVNAVGDINTKTVVLKKNYDDENQVFSVDVEKNYKMTVENLENARKQEVKKPVEICKNKDDQLDVDISRKTKENEKNSKQFSDKSESADEQDCNGGRISLDENLNGLKNSTNEMDKLHEIEIFTGLKDEAQEENLGLYERGTEKQESNANNCAVNTMSGLTKSVQSIVTDITVLETQTKLEELIKDSDLLKEEFSATEKLEGSVYTNCCDEESLSLLTQSVQSIVNVVSTIHAQKNLEKFAEDSNNIVEKLQESKTVSENFSINTNIGLETEAPMSEPTRSVQSIVNEVEDLVTNVDELLNEHSEKVYESQGSEVKTIQVSAEVHQTTIAEVKPSAEVHQTTKGQVKPSAEVHQTTKTEVKPSAEVHQTTKGEMKPSAEVHQTTKGEVKPSAEVHQTTKGEVKPSADVHQTTKGEVKTSAEVHQTTKGEVKPSAEVHQTTKTEVKPSADVHQTTKGEMKTSAEVHQTTKAEVKTSAEAHQTTEGEVKTSAEIHQTTKAEVKTSAEVHQTTKGELKTSAEVHQTTKGEVKTSADVHQTTKAEVKPSAQVHQTTKAEVKPSADVHQTTKAEMKPSAEVHQTTKGEVKPSAEIHQTTKGEVKPSAEVHQTTKAEVKPSAEIHQTTKGEVKPSAEVHQTTKAEVKPSADVHQTTEGEVKTSAEVHQTTEAEESLNAPDISKSTICDTSRPATMVTLTDRVYALVKDMETVDTQNKLESIVKDGQIHKATEDIKTEQNDNESTMVSQTAQSDDVKTPSDLPMVEIIGASNSSFTADDKQHELMRTDIKSIEKGLKDIITEMAANEKCVDDFTKTACISSSLENESSANMLSPLTTIGNGHHIMVRSCEFLPKQGEQLSKSDSLENLSVKSDDGGQSKSKPERKQNSSRIQQSKKHYSPARSYDSQSKTSFKDRNWHYPSTPGRSSNNRHDGCKQPTPGRYDRSFYNSPRHYGQQDSYSSRRGSNYSEKYEHAYRGRETYSNIPRIQRQHGPNNTPDRPKHVDSHKTVDLSSKYLHRGSLSEKRSDKTTGKSSTVDKYGKTGKCENPKKLEVDKPVMENSDKGKCCGSKPKQESCDLSSEVNVKSNETRPNQSSDTVLSRSSENIPVVGKMSMEATETVASNKVGGVAENTSLSAESLNGNVRLPEKGSGKPEYSQNEGAEMKNNGSALPSKQKQKKKRRSSAKYKW